MAYPFHEFFAGSGLVCHGLAPIFTSVWANDISKVKARVYRANGNGDVLHVSDVAQVRGDTLPEAVLSWASFPCQDLSLAGKIGGIRAERSGLVWEWLRIIDELGASAPRVVCLENVSGLVSSHGGQDYQMLHNALSLRGYRAGAVLLNASRFVPQSRPRVFVIASRGPVPSSLAGDGSSWLQPAPVQRAARLLDDFVWWHAKEPEPMTARLVDVLDDAPFDHDEIIPLIPESHLAKFDASGLSVASAYKRTRNHKQTLELRCDGIAGCLRTPAGGSSRQFIVARGEGGRLRARLMTVRETARLMGAPDTFELPGTYNEGYFAMGDAVVAPVAHWLAETFLLKLVEAAYDED